ncbi:hypothetical protein ACN38_g7681 [Penicillium nordicum]|uniref:C2H2-type domain-containing protein n=1 Tax=Penicillium nordicum TaxID=229535 RepID=A0A0M8P6K4_9EURO|nr:hypothetical protein ACN38_g7681 [Penicillium nordicum]
MERCDLCDRFFGDRQALQQHIRDAPAHTLTFSCEPCNRTFVSYSALDQHIRDSPVHTTTYDCEPCSKYFGSQSALDQHVQNSPAHAVSFNCEPCNKPFVSQSALDQHLRDSPVHTTTYHCEPCGRTFGGQSALDQHTQDSPAHTITHECKPCNRSFGSQSALDQHVQNSPAHAVSFHCELCNRTFGSKDALDHHIEYSNAHIAPPSTPLDEFFQSFAGFSYNPKLPPSESYAQLKRFCRWGQYDPEDKEAWEHYQSALKAEVKMWFGAENDLGAWHSLCRAIGIEPLPASCKQAVNVVRDVFVNIVDLITWARSGSTNNRVQRFSSLQKLREYTKETKKVFRNNLDEGDDDGNVVLRHLLRFIFRAAPGGLRRYGH